MLGKFGFVSFTSFQSRLVDRKGIGIMTNAKWKVIVPAQWGVEVDGVAQPGESVSVSNRRGEVTTVALGTWDAASKCWSVVVAPRRSAKAVKAEAEALAFAQKVDAAVQDQLRLRASAEARIKARSGK